MFLQKCEYVSFGLFLRYINTVLIECYKSLSVALTLYLRKESLFKMLSRMDLLNSNVIVSFHYSEDLLVVFENDFQRYLK